MFDPTRPVELETDASDYALGAQLGQRDDQGKIHPVAFYSHKLIGAELNYPIYDKEFLAIVNAFKEFRHYLMASLHQTTVYTDHKNISHFATTQSLSGRQLRYAEYLAEFDYVIIHRKGSENGRADAISRTIGLNYYQSPNSRTIPLAKKASKRHPTTQTSVSTSTPLKISIKTDRITLRPC